MAVREAGYDALPYHAGMPAQARERHQARFRNDEGVVVVATIAFGLSDMLLLSLPALAVMGAADMVSVNIRSSLIQLSTPDSMRGRVSAVAMLFIGASNELGEFESGTTAALMGTVPAVVVGGIGTLAVVALWMKLFPSLRKFERLE